MARTGSIGTTRPITKVMASRPKKVSRTEPRRLATRRGQPPCPRGAEPSPRKPLLSRVAAPRIGEPCAGERLVPLALLHQAIVDGVVGRPGDEPADIAAPGV